jgi:hypothetical protein
MRDYETDRNNILFIHNRRYKEVMQYLNKNDPLLHKFMDKHARFCMHMMGSGPEA